MKLFLVRELLSLSILLIVSCGMFYGIGYNEGHDEGFLQGGRAEAKAIADMKEKKERTDREKLRKLVAKAAPLPGFSVTIKTPGGCCRCSATTDNTKTCKECSAHLKCPCRTKCGKSPCNCEKCQCCDCAPE